MFCAMRNKWLLSRVLRDFMGSTTTSVDHIGREPGRKPWVEIAGHGDRNKRVTGGQEPPSHTKHLTFFRWWWTRSIEKRKVRIKSYLIFVIFLHKQNFWRIEFSPKTHNLQQKKTRSREEGKVRLNTGWVQKEHIIHYRMCITHTYKTYTFV